MTVPSAPDHSGLALLAPSFQPAHEIDGHWVGCGYAGTTPQDGRDSLASHFLKQCNDEDETPERRREFADVAHLLDWQRHDDLLVLGRRFRIVRIDRYVRIVEGVPEAPRPGDSPGDEPAEDPPHPSGIGMDLSTDARADAEDVALKEVLRNLVPAGGPVPTEVTEDALVRSTAHPDLVLLRPAFHLVVRVGGRPWLPFGEEHPTPEAARAGLRTHLDVGSRESEWATSTPHEREAYAQALARCREEIPETLTVLDREYRTARVLRIVRHGFDGPETPRETDPDPHLPPAALYQQHADEGLLDDADEPHTVPPVDPESARFVPGTTIGF